MEILKVSSHSSPNSVAGAIAGVIREKKMVLVQPIRLSRQSPLQEATSLRLALTSFASRHLQIF